MALELSREGAVVVEAAFKGDFRDSFARGPEQVGGDEHSEPDNVFAWADTEALLEKAFELSLGKSRLPGEVGDINGLVETRFDESDDFRDGVVGIVEGTFVALNEPANGGHGAGFVKDRVFVGDVPFRQTVTGGKELDQVE